MIWDVVLEKKSTPIPGNCTSEGSVELEGLMSLMYETRDDKKTSLRPNEIAVGRSGPPAKEKQKSRSPEHNPIGYGVLNPH